MLAATKIGLVFSLLQLFLLYSSNNLGRLFLLLHLIYYQRSFGLTYFFCATNLKDHM